MKPKLGLYELRSLVIKRGFTETELLKSERENGKEHPKTKKLRGILSDIDKIIEDHGGNKR